MPINFAAVQTATGHDFEPMPGRDAAQCIVCGDVIDGQTNIVPAPGGISTQTFLAAVGKCAGPKAVGHSQGSAEDFAKAQMHTMPSVPARDWSRASTATA